VNRSFRHRVGALAAVLLAGTAMLAWASPASAQTTGSEARFGGFVASCPTPGSVDNEGSQTIGTVTAEVIQCATSADGRTASAQVQGTYSGGKFQLQCTRTDGTYILNQQVEGGDSEQIVSSEPIRRTIVLDGVTISVFCGPAAAAPTTTTTAAYPLAVDVGGASGADPALASQAATSAESSGSGATWLFVAGAAALLILVGQLAIGRRIGRNNSATG
jgi:hypothetical protein